MTSESVQIEAAPALTVRGKDVSAEPSRGQVLLLVVFCYSFYLVVLSLFSNYWEVVGPFGDNRPYAQISSAIRHWDFSQLHPKLFWGLPYAMALLSKATGASDLKSLLFISMVCSLVSIFVAYKLWGGWVAGFFAVASREWMERSLLGGAEPLFLACIFGAFVAARKERWLLASLLASLATIVRPMGIFALVGIGIALLVKRDFRRFIAAVLIGATIGLLYILPLLLYLGNQGSEIMQPEFSGSDIHRGGEGRSESARQPTAFAPESAIERRTACCTAGCADQNRAESIDQTSATTETLAKCAQ